MTDKVKIFQTKELLNLQKIFTSNKEKLLHLFLKTNDNDYIQAIIDLNEFECALYKDFLNYTHNQTDLSEFNISTDVMKKYLNNFSNAYKIN